MNIEAQNRHVGPVLVCYVSKTLPINNLPLSGTFLSHSFAYILLRSFLIFVSQFTFGIPLLLMSHVFRNSLNSLSLLTLITFKLPEH